MLQLPRTPSDGSPYSSVPRRLSVAANHFAEPGARVRTKRQPLPTSLCSLTSSVHTRSDRNTDSWYCVTLVPPPSAKLARNERVVGLWTRRLTLSGGGSGCAKAARDVVVASNNNIVMLVTLFRCWWWCLHERLLTRSFVTAERRVCMTSAMCRIFLILAYWYYLFSFFLSYVHKVLSVLYWCLWVVIEDP